jgi:hypothetical protein
MTILFLRKYSDRPMHLFGMLGILFGGLGVVMGLNLTWLKIWSGIQANRFWIGFQDYDIGERPLLLLAVLLVILGVQFLVMGLIAELIVRTYYASQDKTVYYIRQMLITEK